MKRWMRTLLIAIGFTGLITASACNTTKGAGKDLEAAGEGIQNSAERHGAD